MYMIMFVLDDPDLLEDVMETWANAGIHGATILESTGFHRVRRKALPMRYLFSSSEIDEEGHLTLIVIVPTEQLVQDCLHATEALIGCLDLPNTGVFAAWPLSVVSGVPRHSQEL